MFRHETTMLFPVEVSGSDPWAASMLQEQFGGANGELKAMVQYLTQSFATTDPATRSLLQSIATEEASHLEMVGTAIVQLMTKAMPSSSGPNLQASLESSGQQLREAGSLLHKMMNLGGVGPLAVDSSGAPFTGDFINSTGDITSDLSSNLAAELRARRVYQQLHRNIRDKKLQNMLEFLIERESTHSLLFSEALERVKDEGAAADLGMSRVSRRIPLFSEPSGEMEKMFGGEPFTESPLRDPILPTEVEVQLAEHHSRLTPVG